MKTCAHTISCCVYNGNIQLLSHTHIHTLTHTHTHTDGPRAALAVVDWPWKHQVWQTLTNTQISTNTDKHWQTLTNTPSMTTTLTNPNTRNVPWSGREKIEWAQLSAWANTQTHIYSININTSAFTSHMHKHLSTSHVNMSQGLQCHYIPMQTIFFPLWRHSWCHAMSSLKMCNMNKRGMIRCTACHSQKTAEIIHNELIKPGTNTGNKATKKTQLVLMPSDSHQDQWSSQWHQWHSSNPMMCTRPMPIKTYLGPCGTCHSLRNTRSM